MQKSWSNLEVQMSYTDERPVSKTELGEMLSTFGGVSRKHESEREEQGAEERTLSTVRGRGSHSRVGGREGAGADHGQSIGVGTQGERNVEHQEGIQYREDCEKPSVSELTCRGGMRGLGTLA